MNAAIVGATGYAGAQLLSLLDAHPAFDTVLPFRGRAEASAEGRVQPLDVDRFAEVDVVFLCTPHGVAARLARLALDASAKVVDLSADFRLRDPALYESTYGAAHGAPDLLDARVYGLTERARQEVASARLIANPGCYPTSILLPLLPLAEAGVLSGTSIICDSKSGVSGAGVAPSKTTHYGSVHENFRAYGVEGHRHAPEMNQELADVSDHEVVFVPHLLPCFRGILSTLYLDASPAVVSDLLHETYADEPFVQIVQDAPSLRDVQLTNQCHISVHGNGDKTVVLSTIDNLMKGAAGQAVQNANLMLGLEEGAGLA